MGITKLMHMKESRGTPYIHLKNGLEYILDEKHQQKKTGGGVWVGGNCGTQSREILQKFLQTKDMFGKQDGRQGYHFVIAFRPGEVDEAKAYDIAKDFCEEYLGDTYDYVFAVHNDKAHIHAHIIFNSVSRIDGYKYHYKEGDWKKMIQPVTDKVCIKHHIAPLVYDEKKSVSYAQWMTDKNGDVSKKDIVRADVDYSIERSASWEDFVDAMICMGYAIREGYSRARKCAYLSFQPPMAEGKKRRAWRSYNLGAGYSKEELIQRMGKKQQHPSYDFLTEKIERKVPGELRRLSVARSRTTLPFRRMYQAVNYYKLPNPYAVPATKVRQDMQDIEKLSRQCMYLEKNHLHSDKDIQDKLISVRSQLEVLKRLRQTMYGIRRMEKSLSAVQRQMLGRCRELIRILSAADTDDIAWEAAEDELSSLSDQLPEGMAENEKRLAAATASIKKLASEERLLCQISETSQTRPSENINHAEDLKIQTGGHYGKQNKFDV